MGGVSTQKPSQYPKGSLKQGRGVGSVNPREKITRAATVKAGVSRTFKRKGLLLSKKKAGRYKGLHVFGGPNKENLKGGTAPASRLSN